MTGKKGHRRNKPTDRQMTSLWLTKSKRVDFKHGSMTKELFLLSFFKLQPNNLLCKNMVSHETHCYIWFDKRHSFLQVRSLHFHNNDNTFFLYNLFKVFLLLERPFLKLTVLEIHKRWTFKIMCIRSASSIFLPPCAPQIIETSLVTCAKN